MRPSHPLAGLVSCQTAVLTSYLCALFPGDYESTVKNLTVLLIAAVLVDLAASFVSVDPENLGSVGLASLLACSVSALGSMVLLAAPRL